MSIKDCTWVVVEDNVEEVLISPSDVILVLLIEWMQKILPWQATGDHTVLKCQQQRSLANSSRAAIFSASSNEEHIYIPASICNLPTVLRTGELLNWVLRAEVCDASVVIRKLQSQPTLSAQPLTYVQRKKNPFRMQKRNPSSLKVPTDQSTRKYDHVLTLLWTACCGSL